MSAPFLSYTFRSASGDDPDVTAISLIVARPGAPIEFTCGQIVLAIPPRLAALLGQALVTLGRQSIESDHGHIGEL